MILLYDTKPISIFKPAMMIAVFNILIKEWKGMSVYACESFQIRSNFLLVYFSGVSFHGCHYKN